MTTVRFTTDTTIVPRAADEKLPPFVDMVQEALARPEKRMFIVRGWSHARKDGGAAATVGLRMKLDKAKVFKLSNEFVRVACNASQNDPGVFSNALLCARLPYDSMWVEWDEETRLIELAGQVGLDSAMRIGALLQREPGTDDEVRATLFWLHRPEHPYVKSGLTPDGERRVFVAIFDLLWTTGGEIKRAEFIPGDVMDVSFSGDTKYSINGFDYIIGRKYAQDWEGKLLNLNERVVLRSGLGWKLNVGKADLSDVKADTKIGEFKRASLAGGMESLEGDFRFLVTVLALLQTKWVDKTSTMRPSPGNRSIMGTRTKWLDVHECVITAPKERIIRLYPGKVASGGLRRRHDVMGHFCERYGTGQKDCVHEYVQNEKGQEVCRHCKHTRWWRNAHMRGSETVGLVKKTYRVEAP